MTPPWRAIALTVGLTAVTVLTRALFLLPRRAWPIPTSLRPALRFAPAAALAAVVAPGLLLPDALGPAWVKCGAALAAAALGRGRGIATTIAAGMAAYWLLLAVSRGHF